jgi:hypothetical protein
MKSQIHISLSFAISAALSLAFVLGEAMPIAAHPTYLVPLSSLPVLGVVSTQASQAIDNGWGSPLDNIPESIGQSSAEASDMDSGWAIETVDTGGEYTSLALDNSDRPHISYLDLTGSELRYAHWTGSEEGDMPGGGVCDG